jgi:hypothetical protein
MIDSDSEFPGGFDEFLTGEEIRYYTEFEACMRLFTLLAALKDMTNLIEKSIYETAPDGQRILANAVRDPKGVVVKGHKFLKQASFSFCDFLDAYEELADEKLYQISADKTTLTGQLCSMVFTENLILVKSPRAIKSSSLNYHGAFWPLYEHFFFRATQAFADANFNVKNGVRHYVWLVYPKDNLQKGFRVVDPDNVDTKVIGDPLMRLIQLDDNVKNVSIHIDGICTDKVAPGMYTILTPTEGPVWTPETAEVQLESLSKKYNF